MAIDSYANLKQAIERWSHRTDINDVIDDFIDLAENQIDKKLQIRANEQTDTLTASTSSRYLALPSGYIQMRRLTIVSGALNYEIRYRAPEAMEVSNASGRPTQFTVTSQIEFNKVPDSAYSVDISYHKGVTPLSASNTTNNVLSSYPDLYLYGSLIHLSQWENDQNKVVFYESVFEKSLAEAKRQEQRGRFGPAPAMRIEGSTP